MNTMKKTHTIMTVQPMKTCWKYLIIKHGLCTGGGAETITDLALIEADEKPCEVLIDEGFRTLEVRKAAEKYGWTLTRGL